MKKKKIEEKPEVVEPEVVEPEVETAIVKFKNLTVLIKVRDNKAEMEVI